MADPQIDELKALVREAVKVSQDTNKVVHSMRRAGRIKSIAWTIVLVASIASAIYTYYFFIAPKIEQISTLYHSNVDQAQSVGQKIWNFFTNFNPPPQQP